MAAHHGAFPFLTVMHLLHNDNLMGTPVPITSSPVMLVCPEQLTFLPPPPSLYSSGPPSLSRSLALSLFLFLTLALCLVYSLYTTCQTGLGHLQRLGEGWYPDFFYFHHGSNIFLQKYTQRPTEIAPHQPSDIQTSPTAISIHCLHPIARKI